MSTGERKMAFTKGQLLVVAHRIWLGLLTTLLLLFLIVPLAGQYIGANVRFLEMATGLEPQYLGITILLLAFALLARQRHLIFLALVAILFHGSQVIPWYFGKSRPDFNSGPLKVISFNVLHSNLRSGETVDWVIQENPQIAVFQEVISHWPEDLQKLRVAFPFHYRMDDLQMDVFSKLRIQRADFQKFGPQRGFIRFEVDIGRPVTIYVTHTYPQIHFGMEGFRFHRDHLMTGLPADINKHRDNPIIVLGDLNSTMWSPHYAALIQKTDLNNARQGFGICLSLGNEKNWKPWTAVAFDHCLVSKDIGVKSFRTGPFLGSDHLPIVADLLVPERPGPVPGTKKTR